LFLILPTSNDFCLRLLSIQPTRMERNENNILFSIFLSASKQITFFSLWQNKNIINLTLIFIGKRIRNSNISKKMFLFLLLFDSCLSHLNSFGAN
jgi:hypothetical protein